MSVLPTFADVKDVVESHYPLPLAAVFHCCRVTAPENLGGRHKSLIDLFEVFVKLVCICQLQEARGLFPRLREMLPQREKSLEFIRHPSLGSWVGLLRTLSDLMPELPKDSWISRIAYWSHVSKTDGSSTALQSLAEIKVVNVEKRSRRPHLELCNALVSYLKSERGCFLSYGLWTLSLTVASLLLSQSYKVAFPIAIKRSVDYSLIYAVSSPAVRYTIMLTLFVFRYSQKSLKPMLTRIAESKPLPAELAAPPVRISLAQRLLREMDSLWAFLEVQRVELTNYRAEKLYILVFCSAGTGGFQRGGSARCGGNYH